MTRNWQAYRSVPTQYFDKCAKNCEHKIYDKSEKQILVPENKGYKVLMHFAKE